MACYKQVPVQHYDNGLGNPERRNNKDDQLFITLCTLTSCTCQYFAHPGLHAPSKFKGGDLLTATQMELLGQFRLIGDRASDVSGGRICLTQNAYAEI